MSQKQLRKVLVAIKKKIESITENSEWANPQLFEIIEELKAERVIIWGLIEKIDLG